MYLRFLASDFVADSEGFSFPTSAGAGRLVVDHSHGGGLESRFAVKSLDTMLAFRNHCVCAENPFPFLIVWIAYSILSGAIYSDV